MMLNVILVAVDFQCLEFDHHSKIMTLFPSMAGSENIYEFDALFGGLKIKKWILQWHFHKVVLHPLFSERIRIYTC